MIWDMFLFAQFVSWKASLTDILRVNVVLIWSRLLIPMSICITPATFRIFWKNLYMPFQDPLCPFVLGGDEKLGHSAGVLHLDDAHPDILVPLKIRIFEHEAEWLMNGIQMNTVLCFVDKILQAFFGFGVSNLGIKYGYPNNLSVIIFIMKRVAKVGNEEEPKMAMNRFGHVRMNHFQSNTNNIFVNHHQHLLINYFPAHETNRMIHHCIFGFTIPTAMTLVQVRFPDRLFQTNPILMLLMLFSVVTYSLAFSLELLPQSQCHCQGHSTCSQLVLCVWLSLTCFRLGPSLVSTLLALAANASLLLAAHSAGFRPQTGSSCASTPFSVQLPSLREEASDRIALILHE